MRLVAALAALLLGVTGCSDDGESDQPAIEFDWVSVELPAPEGTQGRIAVRDAVRCGGWWYVVGGVFRAPGESRPAVWRSREGLDWTSLPMRAEWYWAKRNVIASVACHGDEIAMVGAKSGGAHGNPRVSTWIRADDGAYVDVKAPFEQYGGPDAVNVGMMAGGPNGFLIVGNRFSGAAVWVSSDGDEFELVDDDPELGKRAEFDTLGIGVAAAAEEWIVVGSGQRKDRVPRIPLAWSSADGRTWHLEEVPYGESSTTLERAVATSSGVLAVGLAGDGFGAFAREAGEWRSVSTFGDLVDGSTGTAYVSSLSAHDDLVLAAVSDRDTYRLFGSSDAGGDWTEVAVPVQPTPAGEQSLVARFGDEQLLLLADDAGSGRVWLADVAP
jgi:hypothetical protein